MLGEKLKHLRESHGLLQRQVAATLDVDTAYVSKIESNEKLVSRALLKKLSRLYKIPESDLNTLWLAGKICRIVKDEKSAVQAIQIANNEIIKRTKRKHKLKDDGNA